MKSNMKNVFVAILFLNFAFCFGQHNTAPKENAKLSKENTSTNTVDDASDYSKAEPKGGITAFNRFVANSFVLPEAEKDTLASVLVKFVIYEDGSIHDIKIIKESPAGLGLGQETIRVLNKAAKWAPAQQNGKVVKQQFVLPLKFQLLGVEKEKQQTEVIKEREETKLIKENEEEVRNKTYGHQQTEEPPEDTSVNYSKIFTSVDIQATPLVGLNAFRKYVASSFKLPEVTEQITGTLITKFVVWDDGSIRDVQIIKETPIGLGLGKEAVRILSSSDKWKPGMVNGFKVKQYYTLPISIQITPADNLETKQKK